MSAHPATPLARAADLWSDEEHQKLDALVNKELGEYQRPPSSGDMVLLALLPLVAKHCAAGIIDLRCFEVENMMKYGADLVIEVHKALELGSYREIRKLAILRRPTAPSARTALTNLHDHRQLLERQKSFMNPFRGRATDGFYQYLTYNNELFCREERRYYGKFCSVVQSSGTGKSRLITELCNKDVLVLYMNIRDEMDAGFPPRDDFPARVLTENTTVTVEAYTARCCAFWIALFDTLKDDLTETFLESKCDATAAIRAWNKKMMMCNMRSPGRNAFFTKVKNHFVRFFILAKIASTDRKRKSVAEEAVDRRSDVSDDSSKEVFPPGWKVLQESYDSLLRNLPQFFVQDESRTHEPKLVLGLDEAHRLHCESSPCAAILCGTINKFSLHPLHRKDSIWVAFVSTSRVDFAPSQYMDPSLRIFRGRESLFPPYTDLGWDQFADRLMDITPSNAAKFNHIAHFGRPLWTSLKHAHSVDDILEVAAAKLSGGRNADPYDHKLALLAQRFGLQISLGHRESVAYAESAVANHMRVCVSGSLDNRASYPSEPMLSCAAAQALHAYPEFLNGCLQVLRGKVDNGMIDRGDHGELAGRLLWLLGKDFYVRSKEHSTHAFLLRDDGIYTWETAELKDCSMIPVVDFLRYVFGDQVWSKAGKKAKDLFAGARLNFSHWVSMDAQIGNPAHSKDRMGTPEWTLRHWCRSSAVQCCHNQTLIDKVIPIYFDDDSLNNSTDRVSHIYISDKATPSSNRSQLSYITRKGLAIDDMKSTLGLPYIAILLDMGMEKPAFSATLEQQCSSRLRTRSNAEVPSLRIYAAGMHAQTFPFLEKRNATLAILQDLVRPKLAPMDRPSAISLRNQVLYGRTHDKDYMEWERGQ
ncbi:hypothetical protein F5I97DRAFT_2039899 [Phlebopus sp. FC_14]|nr:hypothetical protein F5I97DRAFT_2039899 [Phlebopus sp. FC_14]